VCYSGFRMSTRRAASERRVPRQARSRQTVEFILTAATRVFRREGFRATTNRVAAEAGVSVGSLYEYFPDKQALLLALAERHVALAELEVTAALRETSSVQALLAALQRAILTSQRYPSEALALLAKRPHGALQARAAALRKRAIAGIAAALARAGQPPLEAERRARAALGVIGDLTVLAWLSEPETHDPMTDEYLAMAVRYCTSRHRARG
jgi:AcrR family transcriptional regulator